LTENVGVVWSWGAHWVRGCSIEGAKDSSHNNDNQNDCTNSTCSKETLGVPLFVVMNGLCLNQTCSLAAEDASVVLVIHECCFH